MATLIVEVTAECEELLNSLPRNNGWSLESEYYYSNGGGVLKISFDGNELSAAAENALETNDEVISYRVEPNGR